MLMYYMQKKCKICIKNHEIIIELKNTRTAELIWKNLPMTSEVNTWGEEIYFYTSIANTLEADSKQIMTLGEIAYWPTGKAIAIGYGRTPISIKEEIRLADKCNVWGKTKYDLKKLKNITPGEEIFIKKC